MSRATIDYGIDLGTTNSSIAVNRGADIEIIKNEEGTEYTPSVFWIDRNGNEFVGRRAKERRISDPENSEAEFKIKMGNKEPTTFARSGRRMLPEELSAEVLKSLKADVKKRRGEVLLAAVITVPAGFDYPQTAATRKAAELAGIDQVVLLQEPSAAALAYGASAERERATWLIYDLGGGTFDAAVIGIRDGKIKVLNFEGDNNLGGKRIDWAIIEQILTPAVVRRFGVTDFNQFNRRWAAAFAKLKEEAERAKILLSSEDRETVEIEIESLFKGCEDFRGGEDDFQFTLKRGDIEPLILPLVERSIDLCKKALRMGKRGSKEIGIDEIAKVILVGGPTLTPYLRKRLKEFCPRLDFSQDPLTVVSRGAAIASGRLLKKVTRPTDGHYTIDLIYEATGMNPRPPIGGTVQSEKDVDFSEYKIRFVRDNGGWAGGNVKMNPNGEFLTNLFAEPGENVYTIELTDPSGTPQPTLPARCTYEFRKGVKPDKPKVPHTFGVAVRGYRYDLLKPFISKNTELPAKENHVLKTTKSLKKGQKGEILKVPILQGEARRADRNERIGTLAISADEITQNLPIGTEVEVKISVDESFSLNATAYVPLLDMEYRRTADYGDYRSPTYFSAEFAQLQKRLGLAQQKVEATRDAAATERLRRIEDEQLAARVEKMLGLDPSDPDVAEEVYNRLLELKSAVAEVEDAVEWPATVRDALKDMGLTKEIISAESDDVRPDERAHFRALDEEIRTLIQSSDRNIELLEQKADEMYQIWFDIGFRQPKYLTRWLRDAETYVREARAKEDLILDFEQAELLLAEGRAAMSKEEWKRVRAAMLKLWDLIPRPGTVSESDLGESVS